MSTDTKVVHKVTREQLERCLMVALKTMEDGKRAIPVFVYGDPGLGKTDTAYAFYAKAKKALGDQLLPLLERDMSLCSSLDFAIPHKEGNTLSVIYQSWIPFLDTVGEKVLIGLLDEYDRSEKEVQNFGQKMMLSPSIDGRALSDRVFYILCCNGESDDSFTNELSNANRSRGIHLNLSAYTSTDEDEWQDWASRNNLGPEIRTFAKYGANYNEEQCEFAERTTYNYRTRHMADRIIQATKRCSFKTDDILLPLLAGVIGSERASAVIATNELIAECPDPKDILNGLEVSVPESPKKCFAMTSLLMNCCDMDSTKQVRNMLKYFTRMPAEITGGALRNLGYAHPKVASYAEFKEWAIANNFLL